VIISHAPKTSRFKSLLLAAIVAGSPCLAFAAPAQPPVAAVLADPARPEADRARDADRKAAELLTFIGVKPGDKVADLYPGSGYFTRIFAKAVGPAGKVYGVFGKLPKQDGLTNPAFPNITVMAAPWDAFNPPEKLDVIFNSQFYHDFYNPAYGAPGGGQAGVDRVNKAMFEALKPGGIMIIVDHAGRPGTGSTEFDTLHRIEESTAKSGILKAGFVLIDESQVLRNPTDPKTANVFDPAIRGKTDQFVLKFRRPN
jgi:predicted methyltransferase